MLDKSKSKLRLNRIIGFSIFLLTFIIIAYLYKNNFSPFRSGDKDKSIYISFKQKEYGENYTEKYKDLAYEIAEFSQSEKWRGDTSFSDSSFFEENSSMSLKSNNEQSVSIYLDKNIDLSDREIVKLLLYSDTPENSDNIEKLTIKFTDAKEKEGYEFPIGNIKQGMNIISIPVSQLISSDEKNSLSTIDSLHLESSSSGASISKKETNKPRSLSLSTISRIRIGLTSRPNSKAELFFDRLWSPKNQQFVDDFRTINDNMLSLKKYNNADYIYVWSIDGTLALIKKITSVTNYTFAAKLIPLKRGPIGIAGRADINSNFGYYLAFDGIDSGNWQLLKINGKTDPNNVLDHGEINNYIVEKSKPLWIKMELNGTTIKAYFSIDGSSFTKLTEVTDNEIQTGGVGYYTGGGSYLIESFNFQQ